MVPFLTAISTDVNLAEAGHIYSFSPGGPRGNDGIEPTMINDASNLLLVCRICHKTIDNQGSEHQYSVPLLLSWKRSHESRVELVTGIRPDKTSHVLLYGAAIGDTEISVDFQQAFNALFPHRYPADRDPISLGSINFADRDHDLDFYNVQRRNLEKLFRQRVRERFDDGKISHLSVFAIAPQPLLIQLGALLTDLSEVDVYQRHREPSPSWNWPESSASKQFIVHRPNEPSRKRSPVLVLSVSAGVDRQRIAAAMDGEHDVWEVSVESPHNDIIKSPADLSAFRAMVRPLFDEIKLVHGQTTPVHIFPVAPVTCNIELGRIRMPKAHPPWIVYDQINRLGGFVQALQIGETDA